jgi:hypothetical protein
MVTIPWHSTRKSHSRPERLAHQRGGAATPSLDLARYGCPSQRVSTTLVAIVLIALCCCSGAKAAQTSVPAGQPEHEHAVIYGLTGTKLAIAAGVGLGIGATAAFLSRRSLTALVPRLAGLGVGTLIGVYVAHLAVEAVLVGGVYYYWPSERAPEDEPSRSMKLRIDLSTANAPVSPGLRIP